jgi:plastocyanin
LRYLFVTLVATAGLVLHSCNQSPGAAGDRAKPAKHTVSMDGTRFQPVELAVNVGDTVEWVNKDPFPHTATSAAGGFDSGVVEAGGSSKFTPAKSGEFAYVCTLHPTMKGILRVK